MAPGSAFGLGTGEITGEITQFSSKLDEFSESSGGATSFSAQQTADVPEPRSGSTTASLEYEETFDGDTLTMVVASGSSDSILTDAFDFRANSISRYSVTFTVTEQSRLTLFGELQASQQLQTGIATDASIKLSQGFPPLFEFSINSIRGGHLPIATQRLLSPGDYTLEVVVDTFIGSPPNGASAASSFELTMIIGPAPCDNVFTGQGDNIVGTAGDDHLCGGAGDDTIDGLGGNDIIFGDDGNDTIDAGEGDDVVFGERDRDAIDGGAGSDLVLGGDQDDTIDGGLGDDVLFGGLDDDTIDGAGGIDTIDGERGKDVITGGAGDDELLRGGRGNDDVYGCGGADTLEGGPGDDELLGDVSDPNNGCASGASEPGAGDVLPARDVLIGNVGNDSLSGNDGNDRLRGGYGDDTLQGENNNDTILGGPGNDICIGGPGPDRLRGGKGNDGFGLGDGVADLADGGDGCDAAGGFFDDGLDVLQSIEHPDDTCP